MYIKTKVFLVLLQKSKHSTRLSHLTKTCHQYPPSPLSPAGLKSTSRARDSEQYRPPPPPWLPSRPAWFVTRSSRRGVTLGSTRRNTWPAARSSLAATPGSLWRPSVDSVTGRWLLGLSGQARQSGTKPRY